MEAKAIWTRREILSAGLGAATLGAAMSCTRLSHAPAAAGTARTRLGLVTYMVGAEMDLDTLIGVCENSGIEGVELRTSHKHGVEPTLDAAGRARVRERLAKTKVCCRMLGSTCEFHAADAATVKKNIEETRQFIQLAADLKIWGVKVRPNGLRKDIPEEQTLKQIGTALRECGDFAKEKGVALVVECHGSGTSKPANMAKIMEFCGHPAVGLCWNSNEAEVIDGSIRESFALCRPWIRHCHIRALTEKTNYPWKDLFALLKDAKYDGYAMLETKCDGDPVEFLKAQHAAFEAMVS